jgi:mono/diheme cytochrome c family protein
MKQKVNMIRQSLVAVLIVAAVAGFAGITSCEKVRTPPAPFDSLAVMSLKTDIQPIFNSNCATASCHGSAKSPNLSDGKSFNALLTGGYIKAPLKESRLYLQMNRPHPTSGFSATNDRKKIQSWVTQGALNN